MVRAVAAVLLLSSTVPCSAVEIARLGPAAAAISGLVRHEASSTFYASALGGGIFKSTDGGNSWTPINVGVDDLEITALAVAPGVPATLYAGSMSGALYKSVDGGATWNRLVYCGTGDCVGVLSLVVDGTGTHLYVGTPAAGAFISSDGGVSFSEPEFPPSPSNPTGGLSSVLFAGDSSSTVYAADPGSSILYESSDGGSTWSGVSVPAIACISALVADESRLFLGSNCSGDSGNATVFRTEDDGATWASPFYVVGATESDPGGVFYFRKHVASLAIDPEATGDHRLLVGTERDGIYRPFMSTDLHPFVHEPSVDWVYVDAMLVVDGAVLYGGRKWGEAEGRGAMLRGSLTGGGHTTISSGLYAGTVNTIALDPSDHQRVWIGGGSNMRTDGGVWVSADGGHDWSERIAGLFQLGTFSLISPVYDLSIAASDANVAVAVGLNAIYRTTNGGESWTRISSYAGAGTEVLVDAQDASRILLGTPPLQRSVDGGATWTSGDSFGWVTAAEQFGSNVLIAAEFMQLHGSADFGYSWTPLAALPFQATSLARSGSTLYAAGDAPGGLMRSTDGGVTWTASTGDLPLQYGRGVTAIASDPMAEGTLYAIVPVGDGRASALHVSHDGGETWTQLAGFQSPATSLAVRATAPRRVLVGTDGEGTFEVTFRAPTVTVLSSSLNPATPNERVTLRAAVVSPMGGIPSGSVVFRSGDVTLSTQTLSGGEATLHTTTLENGTHSLTASYSGDEQFDESISSPLEQAISSPALASPGSLLANASTTSSVLVSWAAVGGASGYELYVRESTPGVLSKIATSTTTSYLHSGLASPKTYIYQVRAVSEAGVSVLSSPDPATTIVFGDPVLGPAMPARAAHVNELRQAVDAMRAAAGLLPFAFGADVVGGSTVIGASHILQLRSALDAARLAIGLSAGLYTDASLPAGSLVRAAHVQELRTETQ